MSTAPWQDWLGSWDRQQAGYLRDREARFALMVDAVATLGEELRVLDLACGPGSLAQRVLHRLPRARCVAVDLDPVLLALGRGALQDAGGRLQWHEADLRGDWATGLPGAPFDAVVSTTALHWLLQPELEHVYGTAAQLLRPGGLLLNGDHLAGAGQGPAVAALVGALAAARPWPDGVEDWASWWQRLRREGEHVLDFDERERRFAHRAAQRELPAPGLQEHVGALERAGFREVGTLWQDLDDVVLVAVR